jgi:hypothetical protein
MFICRIFIAPGGVGQVYEDIVERSLRTVAGEFSALESHVSAINHFVEFKDVSREIVQRIEAFLREQGWDYDLAIEERCTDAELAEARYVPFPFSSDYIGLDRSGSPVNRYEKPTCPTCLLPQEGFVPNPFCVSEDNAGRVQDAYLGDGGVLIVSEKFMSVAGERLSPCVRIGEVRVLESTRARKRLKGYYFWILPKCSLGKQISSRILKVCPTCGAPTEIRTREMGDKFLDAQIILEDFGDRQHQIALSGNWYGERTRKRPMYVSRDVFVSGEFYSFLMKQKLKGPYRPENVVVTAAQAVVGL